MQEVRISAANNVIRFGRYLYSLNTHGRIRKFGGASEIPSKAEAGVDDHGNLTPNMSGSHAKNKPNRKIVVHAISNANTHAYPKTKDE